MTEEQIQKINELIEQEQIYRPYTIAIFCLLIAICIGLCIYEAYNMKKKTKYRKEWLATLTPEQLKAIKESKKFNL